MGAQDADDEKSASVFHQVSPILAQTGDKLTYLFECPGCDMMHQVHVGRQGIPSWTFNGDLEKPTFNPSLVVRYDLRNVPKVCHSFIRDGKIEFLTDCTHDLAGQTVTIPNWEA